MSLLFNFEQIFGYFCLLIALLIVASAIAMYSQTPKPNRRVLIGCISMAVVVVGYMLSTVFFPPRGRFAYFPAEFMMLTIIGINNLTVAVPLYQQRWPWFGRFMIVTSALAVLFCLPICIYTLYFSA
jgi:hypothetical protein